MDRNTAQRLLAELPPCHAYTTVVCCLMHVTWILGCNPGMSQPSFHSPGRNDSLWGPGGGGGGHVIGTVWVGRPVAWGQDKKEELAKVDRIRMGEKTRGSEAGAGNGPQGPTPPSSHSHPACNENRNDKYMDCGMVWRCCMLRCSMGLPMKGDSPQATSAWSKSSKYA